MLPFFSPNISFRSRAKAGFRPTMWTFLSACLEGLIRIRCALFRLRVPLSIASMWVLAMRWRSLTKLALSRDFNSLRSLPTWIRPRWWCFRLWSLWCDGAPSVAAAKITERTRKADTSFNMLAPLIVFGVWLQCQSLLQDSYRPIHKAAPTLLIGAPKPGCAPIASTTWYQLTTIYIYMGGREDGKKV